MFTLKPNPDNISKEVITAEMFKKATGRDPIQDDLVVLDKVEIGLVDGILH